MNIVSEITDGMTELFDVEPQDSDLMGNVNEVCQGPFVKWPDLSCVFLFWTRFRMIEICGILQCDS